MVSGDGSLLRKPRDSMTRNHLVTKSLRYATINDNDSSKRL